MLKIGLNGFGRIGRAIFRINSEKKAFAIVAINDINPDTKNLAYLLQYDSAYGKFPERVSSTKNKIIIGKSKINVFHKDRVSQAPWEKHKVDIIIDSSGAHQNVIDSRKCLKKGIESVVITHASKEVDFNFVFGVSEDKFKLNKHKIVSSSICDVVAFAPIAKKIEEFYGINHVFVTTLHPWLQYQNLLDNSVPSISYPGTTYEHYVLGRASTISLIPKPTTVGTVSKQLLPFLRGKLSAYSFRIPVGNVSSADLTFELKKKITKKQVNNLFKNLAKKKSSVFGYTKEPLVSIDFIKNKNSVVVDGRWTSILNNRYLKLVIWYDNEWGYSKHVVDVVSFIGSKIKERGIKK